MWSDTLTCKFVFFFALSAHSNGNPLYSLDTRQNDCNIHGSNEPSSLVAVDAINNTMFTSIVQRIIADASSGITVDCMGIHDQAASTLSAFRYVRRYVQQDNSMAYPISCVSTQSMSRQEIIDCLVSSYEVLKNFSASISVITRTNVPLRSLQRNAIANLQDRIDRTLCSIANNGLSQFVNLNSANVHIGPVDIVSDISLTLTQTQIAVRIYKLSKAIEDMCSPSAMPGALTQLLQNLLQETSHEIIG